MKRLLGIAVASAALLILTNVADARHRHHRAQVTAYAVTGCEYDNDGRVICGKAVERYSKPAPRIRTASRSKRVVDANANRVTGLVTVNTAAGIKITVHPAFAHKFQTLIASLVAQGHKPRFITCYAKGHVSGSNHHWGGACDIDQTAWNRTSGFMYHAGNAIRSAGLYDGCSFRDCGHVEAMRGTHNTPPNLYASMEKFKSTRDYQP
jgi:hypothetical protein